MIISVALILFISLGFGLPLILLFSEKLHPNAVLGLSFPIGIGLFTLIMFLTNIFGIRFSLLNEFLILLILISPLLLITNKKIKRFYVGTKSLSFTPIEKVMIGVILFLIVSSFISTLYWPVYMWDSVTLYDFRGHVFANTGFMKEALTNEYHYSYPLLTSLAHSLIYLSGGRYPEFLYSTFYLSLGLCFYGLLREFVSRKSGSFFTMILLLVEPIFSHSLYSYTNLAYTVYLGLGAILIYLWDKKSQEAKSNEVGYLILSGLMVGLSTWVRSTEPFWAAAILIVLIVSVIRKRYLSPFVYALLIYPIIKTWKTYQAIIAGNAISGAGQSDGYSKIWSYIFNFGNWGMIFKYLYDHVLKPWGSILALFVIAFVFTVLQKKLREHLLMFIITFVFFGVLVTGIFVFSVYLDYWYRIGDAIERLSMLFYPLFAFCIGLAIGDLSKKPNK